MSVQAIAWVARQACGGPSGKVLLYALANYADEHGRCWPSQKTLAQDTELTDRSIRTWLAKLEERGLLTIEQEAAGRSRPTVVVLNLKGQKRRKEVPPEIFSAGNSRQQKAETVSEKAENGAAPYIEEPLEPSKEPSNARRDALRAEFEETRREYPKREGGDPPEPAWRAYQKVRKEVDHPTLLAAVRRFREFLERKGKIRTEFVPQMASWLGPRKQEWREWLEPTSQAPSVTDDQRREARRTSLLSKIYWTGSEDAKREYEAEFGPIPALGGPGEGDHGDELHGSSGGQLQPEAVGGGGRDGGVQGEVRDRPVPRLDGLLRTFPGPQKRRASG